MKQRKVIYRHGRGNLVGCVSGGKTVSVNLDGKRHAHKDKFGRECPGSKTQASAPRRIYIFKELPPVVMPYTKESREQGGAA
jgi:hypothetical protein